MKYASQLLVHALVTAFALLGSAGDLVACRGPQANEVVDWMRRLV